jgi:flagellar FliJ protein
MKFEFTLETVLKYRTRLEEQAQQAYYEAKRSADDLLLEIKQMYQHLDEARIEIQRELVAQTSSARLQVLETFIAGQKIKIEMARKEVRQRLVLVEEKQDLLIAATREKMALAKLKERRWAEFKKMKLRKETKILDEMVTTRMSGRIKE